LTRPEINPARNNRKGIQNMRARAGTGVLIAGLVCAASVSFAARPLIIDDADPLDLRQFKIEGGAWYEKDSSCKHWDWPIGLGYGLIPSVEVGLGLGGQFEERTEIDEKSGQECISNANGMGDLILNTKWQFLSESTWLPRQAIVPAVKFPTADRDTGLGSGKIDYDVTWIASKSFCDKMGGHVNLGYSFVGAPTGEDVGDIIHYGVALDYKIVDPLQWVGEVYAEKELLSGTDNVIMFNTGLRWVAIDGLTFDVAAGSHISSAGPDLTATTGLTWEFGFTKEENK